MIFALFDLFEFMNQQCQKMTLALLDDWIFWISSAPDPDLSSGWFRGEYGVMLQISFWLLIPIIFAATVGAILHGGIQQVLRTYMWGLPIGIFGGVACIAVVNVLLAINNEITQEILRTTTTSVHGFYDNFNNAAKLGAPATDPTVGAVSNQWSFVQLILMVFMGILVFFLFIESEFRDVMIYMSVMFIPVSLAAYLWGPIRVWFYNLCELVFTMVFAKFVIAAIAGFGFMVIGYAVTGNGAFGAHATLDHAAATTADAAGANQIELMAGGVIVLFLDCVAGPVLVGFVMSPSHTILSAKSAKQLTPWNHDRKFAGDLLGRNFKSLGEALKK